MIVKQLYDIVNESTKQFLGEESVLQEDLTNVVDIGTEVFNATSVDNYVRKLVDVIGRVIFVNRPYSGFAPKILRDSWEFGSVLEKIRGDMPVATENESWSLEDGVSYDTNIFYKPKVSAKFFNEKKTFEIDLSFTEMQVKESFNSAERLNAFISMLYNEVDKSFTVKLDGLIMKTIAGLMAETINSDYEDNSDLSTKSGVKAVNLLKLYKDEKDATYDKTPAQAVQDPEFLRFCSFKMGDYVNRLTAMSTLFNVGGTAKFTPKDLLHFIRLNVFDKAMDTYLQSNTYHETLTALPYAEVVPYWQGSGENYTFDEISSIDVISPSGVATKVSGIVGVMFDRDAAMVTNYDRRTTTNYNPRAEFFNNYFKMDSNYLIDTNENCVVFLVA